MRDIRPKQILKKIVKTRLNWYRYIMRMGSGQNNQKGSRN